MPPTRRRSGNASTANHSAGQHTLNFGGKARVSKASRAVSNSKEEKLKTGHVESTSAASPVSVHEIEKSTEQQQQQPTAASLRSENVVHEQAKVEKQLPKTKEDIRAVELEDADIQKYWKSIEDGRLASQVHWEDLSRDEKILRHFDLCSQYGPCMGIARLKRWRRANNLDLHPPIEVLAVLLRAEEKGIANEKAYIDELMS